MAKAVNAGEREIAPPGQDALEEDRRAVYTIRAPGVYARAEYRAALSRAGLLYHDPLSLIAVMREGLELIFADDDAELVAHLALVDRYAAELVEAATGEGQVEAATVRQIAELERVLRRHYPVFAGCMADNELYVELAPLEAFRRFVTAWRNVKDGDEQLVDFSTGPDGIPKGLLDRVPVEHLRHVANEIIGLEAPDASAEKNSESPSTGAGTRPRSKTAKSTRAKTRRQRTSNGASRPSGSDGSTSIRAT